MVAISEARILAAFVLVVCLRLLYEVLIILHVLPRFLRAVFCDEQLQMLPDRICQGLAYEGILCCSGYRYGAGLLVHLQYYAAA